MSRTHHPRAHRHRWYATQFRHVYRLGDHRYRVWWSCRGCPAQRRTTQVPRPSVEAVGT